jgi:hypothetical protein
MKIMKNELQIKNYSVTNDELSAILEKHLFYPENDANKLETLIYNVVVEYMVILMDSGNIPHQLCLPLELDLKEEVLEMYERRPLGFRSLTEFREVNKN